MTDANIIKQIAASNRFGTIIVVSIKNINEIEDIIKEEALKGKFGVIIEKGNLNFEQIIPKLEANSYVVDNYKDYIGIYWP